MFQEMKIVLMDYLLKFKWNKIFILFFKKVQIDKEFYIWIKKRKNSQSSEHHIIIANMIKLTLPYNDMVSYYISDESKKIIKSSFDTEDI